MSGERILLVNKNSELQEQIRHVIVGMNYEVECEKDPAIALRKLQEDTYHLVIYDNYNEGLNGRELLAKLQDTGSKTCVVLLIEENPDVSVIVSLMQEGVFSFLTLPVESEQIRMVVNKGIENRKSLCKIIDMADELREANKKLNNQKAALETEKKFLEEKTQELQLLNDISNCLNSSLETERIVSNITFNLPDIVAHDILIFFIEDGEKSTLDIVSKFMLSNSQIDKIKNELIESHLKLSGKIVNHGDVLVKIKMVREEHADIARISSFEMIKNRVDFPLRIEEKNIGMLTLMRFSEVPFSDDHARILSIIANQTAVALKNAIEHKRVSELATIDELTSSLNYRAFQEILEREFFRTERYESDLSLIMLDIDNFKTINDSYGHSVGDDVLKALTNNIRKGIRQTDFLARFGGDEFAVILPETNMRDAGILAERTRKSVEEMHVENRAEEIRLTISLGIAGCPREEIKTKNDLIEFADSALYYSKGKGGNAFSVMDELNGYRMKVPRKIPRKIANPYKKFLFGKVFSDNVFSFKEKG